MPVQNNYFLVNKKILNLDVEKAKYFSYFFLLKNGSNRLRKENYRLHKNIITIKCKKPQPQFSDLSSQEEKEIKVVIVLPSSSSWQQRATAITCVVLRTLEFLFGSQWLWKEHGSLHCVTSMKLFIITYMEPTKQENFAWLFQILLCRQ